MNIIDFQDLPLESFTSICRTCLMYTETEKFSIMGFSWENSKLKDVLYVCASLEVDDGDEMPKNMCSICIRKIYDTHKFLLACKKSNGILKQILSKCQTTETTTKNDVSIEHEIKSDFNEIDFEGDYVDSSPYNEFVDPDDPDEVKTEFEESTKEGNPNNKLISTIKNIRKEIKQIRVKNRRKIGKLQRAQLLSYGPKLKRPYVKTKGPPFICITCHASFQDYEDLRTHKLETKHKKARKFVCPYCQRRHDAYTKYLEHVRTHTGEKPNICTTCGKGFNFKTDLRRHMVLHSEVKPYNCGFCDKGFTRKQYLTDHERKHTGERLICLFCGKGFHSYSTLSYHEKTHKGPPGVIRDGNPMSKDKYYQCHLCDKVLLTEQTLRSHILLHGPKNFSCEICGKTYISKNRLQDHIRFAHQDNKFPCTLCDKVYKQKGGLDIHMKSHTGENIYPCEICNKHFACKGSLYQHRRIHTGDTRYQCKECFHICINKRHLENHLRTHTGEKPFSCEYCSKAFAQKANLSAHMKIHTGDKKHHCTVCGKSFYDGRSVKKHMSVHEKTEQNIDVYVVFTGRPIIVLVGHNMLQL